MRLSSSHDSRLQVWQVNTSKVIRDIRGINQVVILVDVQVLVNRVIVSIIEFGASIIEFDTGIISNILGEKSYGLYL